MKITIYIYLLGFFGSNEENIANKTNKSFNYEACTNIKKSSKWPNILKTKDINFQNNNISHNNNISDLTPGLMNDKIFKGSTQFGLLMLKSLSCSNPLDLPYELPPENARGNVEYKRQLLDLTPLRMQQLITQLKWRLDEGQGEAIYEIGVEDNGSISGLELDELNKSLTYLYHMANTLNASVTLICECNIGTKKALEILIRRLPTYYSANEIKVAVLGNMDAGKSTLIGVLTRGNLDDGQGKMRLSTFQHIHEVRSGRTSSISCQLLGFDVNHIVTNFYWQKHYLNQGRHDDVALLSIKLVSLIDMAGCWKYQRTTLFALTSRRPHYILLVISANQVLKGTAIHHIQVSEVLRLPIAIVITKIDRCSPDKAIRELRAWFRDRSPPSKDITVVTMAKEAQLAADKFNSGTIPIFPASCVTGERIEVITTFLGALRGSEERPREQDMPAEVWINNIYLEVPRVDGCVVVGMVHSGSVHENDLLYLGPQRDGHFIPVSVHSIHRNRLQHYEAYNGHFAAFAISIANNFQAKVDNSEDHFNFKWFPQSPTNCFSDTDIPIQRGIVLLDKEPADSGDYFVRPCSDGVGKCSGHVAWGVVVTDIILLKNNELLMPNMKEHSLFWTVHCGNISQRCHMMTSSDLANNCLIRNISNPKVIFRFNNFPQFVHCNDPFMFYKSQKHMMAHGKVRLLIGRCAWHTRTTVSGQL